tara:strand:- start:58 stop:1281 length:1224 start_codon:yes stop_codon:yes gene_type:complete
MSRLPLKGIKVLDLTSVIVGPVATRWLADYGADVIKVEPEGGDLIRTLGGVSSSGRFSPKYLNFNRNKRSLGIDLKHPEAQALMRDLIAQSDIVITNMRHNALVKLGLDYASVSAIRPDVIHCSIVGFDQRGPYAGKPAYDTIVQGASGFADTFARMEGTPRYVPLTITDHIVGFIAVQMVLLALLHRRMTGEGQSIEVPMFENMADFILSEHMGQKVFTGSDGPTGDLRILNPLTQPIRTSDGYICVSANTDKQAFALFDAIDRPDMKTDPRFSSVSARLKNIDLYLSTRDAALARQTSAHWLEIFDRTDVPAMPCHTFESLMADDQLSAVEFFDTLDHPVEGRLTDMRLPNRTSKNWEKPSVPAPDIGQDTDQVLRDLGYPDNRIAALRQAGAVFGRNAEESHNG